jgi:hypothetical protein
MTSSIIVKNVLLVVAIQHIDHTECRSECHYSECRYAEFSYKYYILSVLEQKYTLNV